MPDFWFALMAIALLVTGPTVWFHLDQPIFYSIGLHTEGVTGFNLDYFRHLALPVLDADRAERRGVEPLPARVDARRAERRLRAHRAREGRAQRKVIFKHAFRNALIPFVTVIALDTAFLFGGLIITEQIFSIPGMGRRSSTRCRRATRRSCSRGSSITAIRHHRSTCSPTSSTSCSTRGSGCRERRRARRSTSRRRVDAELAPVREPVARSQLAAVPAPVLPPQAGAGRRSSCS